MPSAIDSSGFPVLRAVLATTLATGVGVGCAVLGAFVLMVALNGFSERDAVPIFVVFAALFATGTALLVALVNVLALGRTSGGGRRWLAAAALGAVAGALQLAPILVFLVML